MKDFSRPGPVPAEDRLLAAQPVAVNDEARWIWHPPQENMENFYLHARRVFDVPDEPLGALLQLAAHNWYQVWVNGVFIGRGPDESDLHWQYVHEYDVTTALHPGRNVIAVFAHNYGPEYENITQQREGPGGLLVQLDVACAEGSVVRVWTDESWRVKQCEAYDQGTERINRWLGFKETFDARRQEHGWQDADFDDTHWPAAHVLGPPGTEPFTHLVARQSLRQQGVRSPMQVRAWEEGSTLFVLSEGDGTVRLLDEPIPGFSVAAEEPLLEPGFEEEFGEEVAPVVYGVEVNLPDETARAGVLFADTAERVCYPTFMAGGTKGLRLEISYCEGPGQDLEHVDTLILEDGPVSWTPFTRRAFRHLQIVVAGGPGTAVFSSPVLTLSEPPFSILPGEGCAEVNNAMDFLAELGEGNGDVSLGTIFETGRETMICGTQAHFEDSVWREQSLWVGDARLEGIIASYLWGDHSVWRKCLLQMAQIQNPDGSIPGVGPQAGKTLLPDYCAYYVISVWDYYWLSADGFLVETLEPAVNAQMDWFQQQLDDDGLITNRGKDHWWTFIDWAEWLDKREQVTALNCVYHGALQAAGKIAGLLGDRRRAERYHTEAERLKRRINELLWSDEAGAYVDCRTQEGPSEVISQQTNALAIVFGVADADRWDRIWDLVLDSDRVPPCTTPYMNYYICQALFDSGRPRAACDLIQEYWGEMARRGTNTFWETFDPRDREHQFPAAGRSWCHGWSAGPCHHILSEICGIKPLAPGFARVAIRPQLCDMGTFDATAVTVRGLISVEWNIDAYEDTVFDIAVPRDTPAEIELPEGSVLNSLWPTSAPRLPGNTMNFALEEERLPDGGTRYILE